MSRVMDAKLHCPIATGLARPRLLSPLVDEDGPGVVVVIAPPGSGKTTLLARGAASSPRRTAWCASGPEDRSGSGFLHHVTGALSVAVGVDLGRPTTVEALLDAFIQAGAPPVLLLLDDVHELEGGPGETHLAELLRWRPHQIRVVLGTRRPLSVNTPRLMVSDELIELDGDALRFRSWEVEELFRLVYDEPLSPEAAAALSRRTGGWAAGLKLFQLATAGKSSVDRERAVAGLGGRSRLLRSYLTRTVLDEVDPDRREFLLLTSTLGTLTGPLCDALLGRDGSAAVLEELANQQFFTMPAEDGASYRYHQVLQTLLEGLLVDELGTSAALQVYGRSARLLEEAGLPGDAVRAYSLADDFASVARLVQQTGTALTVEVAEAHGITTDDPWLGLAHARRLQRLGALAESVAAFRHAEGLLDDADFRRRCQEERAAVNLWLGGGDRPPQDGQRASGSHSLAETARRATYRLGEDRDSTAPPLARGLCRLLAGDPAAARAALARDVGASVHARLVADLAMVVAETMDGAGRETVGRLEQIVLTADLEDQPWLARLARGLQATVLLVSNPDAWRSDSCASVVEECSREGDDWGAMLLAGCLGAALVRKRDPAAEAWLARADERAAALDAPVLRAWLAVLTSVAGPDDGPEATRRAERARILTRACGLTRAESVAERLRSATPPEATVADHRPPASGRVGVRCLGTFAIDVDGHEVALPPLRPRPTALLLLLALHHGRDLHREVIIDLLWPDVSVESATHRLHAAASSVRKCLTEAGLGERTVQHHGGAYRLSLGETRLDVAEFESALREAARFEARDDLSAALTWSLQALNVYRGDLLPEAGPAEWVVDERDRLRTEAAGAAYAAGRLSLRLRSPAHALPWARRATELEPLRDSAWALLAEVQTRMGDVRAAAATRREHALVTAEAALPG